MVSPLSDWYGVCLPDRGHDRGLGGAGGEAEQEGGSSFGLADWAGQDQTPPDQKKCSFDWLLVLSFLDTFSLSALTLNLPASLS